MPEHSDYLPPQELTTRPQQIGEQNELSPAARAFLAARAEQQGKYDSTQDTLDHISKVRARLQECIGQLEARSWVHDESKLQSPEKEAFDEVTPLLRGLTYNSPEYHANTARLGPALAHHYAANSHHPEHYPDGIAGMTLIDLVEMFCDWKAASERHADGNFERSIQINRERFAMPDQLAAIFENTRLELGW